MIDLGLDKNPADTRVVVAMSGGVDSSTVAALVAEAGYQTIGMTMQLYDHGVAVEKEGACCAGQDIHDARRVADQIGIPHYVLNYEDRFREQVMEDFADTYLRGETPIPCVRCNQTVKFKDMVGQARDLGADLLVTGHYVRWAAGPGGAPEMHRAADPDKDQSYFLFATTREQLAFLRFPLGGMDKAQTRSEAERLGLAVAQKAESQDICFVPDGDYARVVERLRPEAHEPGDIVHLSGDVLGRHEGVIRFTVGQRRGLGIGGAEPLYVVRLEPETKRVIVGPKEALERGFLTVQGVNWLGEDDLRAKVHRVQVKIRSMFKPVSASLFGTGETTARVKFDEPQSGVAPGQACVFYQGDRVLGGGWIAREPV